MLVLHSLHSRLLAWLVIPLLFLSGAHLVSTYIGTQNTAEGIFDKLLVTLALSISEHTLYSGGDLITDDLLELIRVTTNDNLYYKVIGPGGAFITGYEDIPEPEGGIQIQENNLQFYDANYIGQDVRIIAVSSLVDSPEYAGWMTTFVAQTKNERDRYVESIILDDLWRVLLMIVLATGLLSVGVSLGLRPLRKVQNSVRNRSNQDLSPLNSDKLPDELSSLVNELNALLIRLSDHVSITKRFVENAAHQLRTPITALLPQTELAVRHSESERELATAGKMRDSAKKIARLTNQLLNLTHAESISLNNHKFLREDLAEIAESRANSFLEFHTDTRIKLELEKAKIDGIELFIGEAIDNMLDNSLKYADSDEPITIKTYISGENAILEIADLGPGIKFDERKKAVERFTRLCDTGSGSGLGLAIVKEIVEAHGGTLILKENRDDAGLRTICKFPVSKNSLSTTVI